MSFDTADELMPTNHKDMLPECDSPSNTESDRDPNTDELPSKPADGENESSDEEPAAGEGLSEEVYEVEKILDHDETKEGLFYLGRKSSSKTPKGKSDRSHKKGSSVKSSSSSSSKKRSRQKASVEKSESEPEPEIPSDDIDDEDYNEKAKNSKKVAPPKGSGTITKAALKSYSPTTPRNRRGSTSTSTYVSPSETLSAAKKDFEVKPDPMQALLMRQSWLYDSDSDEDSGTEKENEKRMEQRKQIEEEQLRLREREEEEQKQKEESRKVIEEPPRSSERKRKAEEGSSDKKKRHKVNSLRVIF
ncbi:hypothetical protein TELCIR_19042 [Teladorsagia circumcincta]|uniref:Uncharacterized protein n=1 Tax=Teladorsagia circumcincta TaxID=45464 RepID=A0A2G9TNC9_TELCI|nr:hypothetical protein TELCIR_19042 [Teladorsagia circumcincta]